MPPVLSCSVWCAEINERSAVGGWRKSALQTGHRLLYAIPRHMKTECSQNWEGSLTCEKVTRYLPHFKSAIQIPIYVLGIDV